MASERKCDNCMYFVPLRPEPTNRGECRRYPPRVHILPHTSARNTIESRRESRFPNTVRDAFCGEFQPAPEGEE